MIQGEGMNKAQICRAAARYLRVHGWLQGSYGADGGPRCLAGAVMSAIGMSLMDIWHDEDPGYAILLEVTHRTRKGFATWNDDPARTKEQVLEFLEALAFDEELRAAAAPSRIDVKAAR